MEQQNQQNQNQNQTTQQKVEKLLTVKEYQFYLTQTEEMKHKIERNAIKINDIIKSFVDLCVSSKEKDVDETISHMVTSYLVSGGKDDFKAFGSISTRAVNDARDALGLHRVKKEKTEDGTPVHIPSIADL